MKLLDEIEQDLIQFKKKCKGSKKGKEKIKEKLNLIEKFEFYTFYNMGVEYEHIQKYSLAIKYYQKCLTRKYSNYNIRITHLFISQRSR